ncbi:macrolide family glycosyltransferase [Kitasatospora griseola]|uniref:macrolide family glycosyltransferase n=1 Tax=Kitasatospora griseola TaxID=2064 RepID=UPI0019B1254F|nr:macrolide family glycosyltransferase [Kitasatospora griseola]GGQ50496.1 macrolide-inactivating glycosyltransferase [Kitasatospora griseola]
MTRRAHIAMIGIPAVSHVRPSLEVIRELVARGHRVTYFNDPSAAELIVPTGAEFVPYPSTLPVADHDWPADPIGQMRVFLEDAIAMLPRLRAQYDADPADLYLYDIGAYAARALAEAQGRPVVQLSPAMVAWDGYQEEVGGQIRQLPGADAYFDLFSEWLAGSGATTVDVDAFVGQPARVVAMITEAMQPNAERVDRKAVDFVGPCFDLGAEQGAWQRPAGAEKVLLVSLGSAFTRQPAFYRNCLAAFGDRPGWHVVLQIGKFVDPAELGEVPANVEVHPWVPQRAILEQADAFVTHAGMGGCAEGLLAGVPMIAVPQAADQPMNADRLVELGVARRLETADATPEALWSALTELVADEAVAARLRELSALAKGEGGTARACDLIEQQLG